MAKFRFDSALLDCCFSFDSNVAFAGGLDCTVHELDLARIQSKVIGKHTEAVKCVNPCKTTGT